ncbi:MAG: hypothetical protein ACOYM3_16265 [Terrimicrobiaceae bacterium]
MSFKEFDRGIPSLQLNAQHQQQPKTQSLELRDQIAERWQESERILGILRTIKPEPQSISDESMLRWFNNVKQQDFFLTDPSDQYSPYARRIESPNLWFHLRFPEQAKRYGNAFLEETTDGGVCPVLLNTDIFGAILGGEKGLGHQVVFCPWESQWYYHDPVVEAFCPTTTAKLQILASNYLIKCAECFSNKATITPLLDDFRSPNILQAITYRAKSILEADRTFFEGPNGRPRYIEGHRIDPTSEPLHRLFLKEVMVRQPGALLTVRDAFRHYSELSRKKHLPALRMVEFKNEVSAIIHEEFNIRLRHDVEGEDGRATHGWRDLSCTFE